MKHLWSFVVVIFNILMKMSNLLLALYFVYHAHKAATTPESTYMLFAIVFMVFWLHDESQEQKRALDKSFDSLKDEVRSIRRRLPAE